MSAAGPSQPAFLFDLDGTLIDSVYQHVLAWRDALRGLGIDLPVWKIHRRIGMSGGLFVAALAREVEGAARRGRDRGLAQAAPGRLHPPLRQRAAPAGRARAPATLTENGVPWAIATSGVERYARLALEMLQLPDDTSFITRDQVRYAKPDPRPVPDRGRADRRRHRR